MEKAISYEQLRPYAGRGTRFLFEQAYAFNEIAVSEDQREAHIHFFLQLYTKNIAHLSVLFPGVVSMLEALQARGASLSICTNKPFFLADKVLKEFKISSFFQQVITPDTTPQCKPNALHLKLAVKNMNPKKTALIGDTDIDIKTAQSYGAVAILMKHGYQDKSLEILQSDQILENFSTLVPTLESIFRRRLHRI